MPRETAVMDKTFRAYGSIGSWRVVSCDVATPGYCKTHAGTLTPGTLPGIGITQQGSSKSGDEISVRMLGISKCIFSATQGSNPLGRPLYPRRIGKVSVLHFAVPAGTPCFSIGFCTDAEGTGSAEAFGQVFVLPQFIGI